MDVISLSHGLNFNMMVGLAQIVSVSFYNYLNLRQIRQLRKRENLMPQLQALNIQYDTKELSKTYDYNIEKKGLGLISSYYSLFVLMIKLYCLFFGDLYNYFYFFFEGKFWGIVGYTLASSVIDTLVMLPFAWYAVFSIEEKFGFNKMKPKTFALDKVKELCIGSVMGVIFYYLLDLIMVRFRQHFILIAWVAIILFNFLVIIIYPIVIIPCFYKLELLSDEDPKEKEIMEKLREMCRSLNFPLKKIYKMDGSSRSSHSQAFFFGIFKNKQVVLYDTVIEKLEVDEIVSVLCHEIGHWYFMHTYQMMAFVFLEMLGILYLFSFCIDYDKMYFDFGFTDRVYFMGFNIFMMLLEPFLKLINSAMCALTRKNEFQADSFAVKFGYQEHLKTALGKICKDNSIDLNPDPLYSMFNNTHPNVLQRVRAINQIIEKKK